MLVWRRRYVSLHRIALALWLVSHRIHMFHTITPATPTHQPLPWWFVALIPAFPLAIGVIGYLIALP